MKGKILICKHCNKPFYVPFCRLSKAKYCSKKCYSQSKFNGKLKTCPSCNLKFYRSKYHAKKQKYCSRKCYYLSEDFKVLKEKILKKAILMKTPSTKRNMSLSRKKYLEKHPNLLIGKNNPNWRGGRTEQVYPLNFNKELKRKIKIRDNFVCQECGLEKVLCVHHIDYNKKNNKLSNLIALCRNCHSKTNISNRKHWKEHFQMKIFIKEIFNPQNILIFNENKQLRGIVRI